jgi:hypothetical protein
LPWLHHAQASTHVPPMPPNLSNEVPLFMDFYHGFRGKIIELPSGKRLHSYGKWQIYRCFTHYIKYIKMVMFHIVYWRVNEGFSGKPCLSSGG